MTNLNSTRSDFFRSPKDEYKEQGVFIQAMAEMENIMQEMKQDETALERVQRKMRERKIVN